MASAGLALTVFQALVNPPCAATGRGTTVEEAITGRKHSPVALVLADEIAEIVEAIDVCDLWRDDPPGGGSSTSRNCNNINAKMFQIENLRLSINWEVCRA